MWMCGVCRIGSSNAVDTICITVEDYCQDFIHLKDQFYDALIQRMLQRVACEYYKALFTAKYATDIPYLHVALPLLRLLSVLLILCLCLTSQLSPLWITRISELRTHNCDIIIVINISINIELNCDICIKCLQKNNELKPIKSHKNTLKIH